MKLPRNLGLELVVAGLTLTVAGAFTQVSVKGEAPGIIAAVEQQATELGKKIFLGKGNCAACHGQNLKGTPLAPNLTDAEWINIDGTLPAIQQTVKEGVAKPKKHPAPMPPMGGAKLNQQEIDAVAEFVQQQSKPAAKQ